MKRATPEIDFCFEAEEFISPANCRCCTKSKFTENVVVVKSEQSDYKYFVYEEDHDGNLHFLRMDHIPPMDLATFEASHTLYKSGTYANLVKEVFQKNNVLEGALAGKVMEFLDIFFKNCEW